MNHLLRRTAPAAVAALLSTGLLAGCGSKTADDAADAGTPTPPATTSAPTTAPTSAATSASTVVGEPATKGLVYFVTTTPLGARITGEETQIDPTADTLVAVQSATPTDPDYRNLVPRGSLADAHARHGEITIALTKPSFATTTTLSAADAKLAVQQVVYSANAANGTAAHPLPVHFVGQSGADSTYLGQPSLEKPGAQLRTLALMSVLSPVDGSTLPAARTTFRGVGSSFEATVGWKITDASGKSVAHGSTMASGWMDKLYPWKVTVDLAVLPAGRYTFTASTDDPSEGEGGGPVTDTKTFTVG